MPEDKKPDPLAFTKGLLNALANAQMILLAESRLTDEQMLQAVTNHNQLKSSFGRVFEALEVQVAKELDTPTDPDSRLKVSQDAYAICVGDLVYHHELQMVGVVTATGDDHEAPFTVRWLGGKTTGFIQERDFLTRLGRVEIDKSQTGGL